MAVRVILTALALCLGAGSAIAGSACGSKVGGVFDFNQVATEVVIPDQFPPRSPVLLTIVGTTTILAPLASCAARGHASLARGCIRHDRCYDTKGADKHLCDGALLRDWRGECHRVFPIDTARAGNRPLTDEQFLVRYCLKSCLSFVQAMAEVQRLNIAGFCPSCEAYSHAQSYPLYFPRKPE